MTTDELESWFERGVTDGLPVVPPTRERVEWMLGGTRRDRAELVGADATIGRALRLLMINIGGARPGETSMSTFGHPGRYTYCIAEHEEVSPWPPYHVSRGLSAETSAVRPFAGEAPHGISDHASRTAVSLAGSLGCSMAALWNSKHFPPVLPHHAGGGARARAAPRRRGLVARGSDPPAPRADPSPVPGRSCRTMTTARARTCASRNRRRTPTR